ncbi:hypothetical protein HW555_009844 [Spodoptera exigua]|uniref:Uncharacterized protein n=1 Tax=Spodoptera exigua TaxID=7107 RepID=A0A835GBM3_SPOEX|nr:hypothetical protein HW555_009844 [Spodoptera exigua]
MPRWSLRHGPLAARRIRAASRLTAVANEFEENWAAIERTLPFTLLALAGSYFITRIPLGIALGVNGLGSDAPHRVPCTLGRQWPAALSAATPAPSDALSSLHTLSAFI